MNRFAGFIERLQGYAPLPCVVDGGRAHTYAHLMEEFDRWRRRCDEWKIAPGMAVGLRADYSLPAVAALLALLARNAIVALIPRDRDPDRYLADACAHVFLELDSQGEYRLHVRSQPAAHVLLDRLRASGDGGVVIFTSGSTGRPKAALQSLERFLHKFERPGRCYRTLAFLLFDHVAGLDTLFYTLANGGALVLVRRRHPEDVLHAIDVHDVEALPTSPTFLRLLCRAETHGEHDLSSLKIITYGSEPMDLDTLERLNRRFPNVQISQKYGTTETGSPRSVSRGNDSVWLKLKREGVETKVVEGILWIRSEGTMLGYLNAPSAVDEDGWYCTGDLVEVDGEWLRFRGRAADTINVGGEKVAPTEIEQAILELDFVSDAVASGERHSLLGEVVVARVSFRAQVIDEQEAAKIIRAHCRQRLGSHSVPVRIDFESGPFASARQKAQRKRSGASLLIDE
jgi:long-chain acyl-CoA synthetase